LTAKKQKQKGVAEFTEIGGAFLYTQHRWDCQHRNQYRNNHQYHFVASVEP